jgi:hypothetical protein
MAIKYTFQWTKKIKKLKTGELNRRTISSFIYNLLASFSDESFPTSFKALVSEEEFEIKFTKKFVALDDLAARSYIKVAYFERNICALEEDCKPNLINEVTGCGRNLLVKQ